MKKFAAPLAAALVLSAPLAAFAATPRHDAARPASSAARLTKAGALNEIRTDGYTDVSDLRQTSSGWTAKAKEGDQQVSLAVNPVLGVRKQ